MLVSSHVTNYVSRTLSRNGRKLKMRSRETLIISSAATVPSSLRPILTQNNNDPGWTRPFCSTSGGGGRDAGGGGSGRIPSPSDGPDSSTVSIKTGLNTKEDMLRFINRLSDEQRLLMYNTLNINVIPLKYHEELGHYLTKFGRTIPHPYYYHPFPPPPHVVGNDMKEGHKEEEVIGRSSNRGPPDVPLVPDPSQSSTFSEKVTETETTASPSNATLEIQEIEQLKEELIGIPATGKDIWTVGLKNALPFVGFGFLDNLIMILAGDYIDIKIGTALGISTMAAAALGNTISDVAGIGSAFYVEKITEKVGIRDPVLTAFQLSSRPIRWAVTTGRAIGVVIGCLLGMVPLLFLPSAEEKKEASAAAAAAQSAVTNVKK